ncbi:potassium channel subfamily K member 13 [Pipistrellus kuhlii]|uniref:Potassium two pore domain channel subfamily K member 13 n=1 Tax=Pipistrellus kuhlii TaxID=59472 RepID=A0A7J8B1Q6_PIPKU|nr:potassium channel subfamily K member 13 [Pipistrellus kuhlii]KAF6392300.1 potassium two pore domain channel subfamily K member 13 [Pipistrellus kuhlii]
MACRGCGCGPGHLSEDNARFLLLAALIALYLLGGAAVFSALELAHERQAKQRWEERLADFGRRHNLSRGELRGFLRHYEEAAEAGVRVDHTRPRWDFTGAFYFVGTVVSTIGFGMTTPATVGGKIFLIFYGLLGCASTILFFNLFLERLITVIAHVMKCCHQQQRLRREGAPPRGSPKSQGCGGAGWKPSVYYVMLILCLASLLVSGCASAMYTCIEGWSYFDSLYFCFVAFSTIGFGDLVSSQHAVYESQGLYRVANFAFILVGVCCIYSLFNVISILIKQSVNWILRKLDGGCCGRCRGGLPRARRNAVTPGHVRSSGGGGTEGEAGGRRPSEEVVSMKDFLAANKVSLAVLQKQLSETANGCCPQAGMQPRDSEFSGGVGAFAIMNNRLAETSGDR